MFKYPKLRHALTQMSRQSDHYRPTPFWEQASVKLFNEFERHGIENFRQNPVALSYFVPTYGPPTLGLNLDQVAFLKETLEDHYPGQTKGALALNGFLNGHFSALSDYRVFLAANYGPDVFGLKSFSESSVGNPVEQFCIDGRRYSRSSLNYLLGLSLLKRHVNLSDINTVLEIGGGFGTLGEILGKAPKKGIKYINIDIPPTNFAADYYLGTNFGNDQVGGFYRFINLPTIEISSLPDFTVLCSWQIEGLKGQVDLFVNFISFQEMEPYVVKNYLDHVNRLGAAWVLLRNMREGKQMKTLKAEGVNQPILSDDYKKMLPNYRLIEQVVHPFGYETVDGFHSEIGVFIRRDLNA